MQYQNEHKICSNFLKIFKKEKLVCNIFISLSETLYTIYSETQYTTCLQRELNSWLDSSVGQSIRTEFSGRGFKSHSHSGQLSIATSNNPSVVNSEYHIIYITFLFCLPKNVSSSIKQTAKQNMELLLFNFLNYTCRSLNPYTC